MKCATSFMRFATPNFVTHVWTCANVTHDCVTQHTYAHAYRLFIVAPWYLRDAWKQDCSWAVRFGSCSVLLVGYQLLQKLERVDVSRLTPRTGNGLSSYAISNLCYCFISSFVYRTTFNWSTTYLFSCFLHLLPSLILFSSEVR